MSKYEREIRTGDDPILRQPCDPLMVYDDAAFIDRLMTIGKKIKHAVGLAAPQIGVAKRVIFINVPINGTVRGRVLINPRIIRHSSETDVEDEGCLSYPGVVKAIERWMWIDVEFQAKVGGPILTEEFSGFPARVVQHEIEHLDGVCRVGDDSPAAQMAAAVEPQ